MDNCRVQFCDPAKHERSGWEMQEKPEVKVGIQRSTDRWWQTSGSVLILCPAYVHRLTSMCCPLCLLLAFLRTLFLLPFKLIACSSFCTSSSAGIRADKMFPELSCRMWGFASHTWLSTDNSLLAKWENELSNHASDYGSEFMYLSFSKRIKVTLM